jgi:sigma-B regulation protein RsbU (phosphoserine phosphatase)
MMLEPYSDIKVLIIDDTDFSREIVGHILRGAGIQKISFAKDGLEGLNITRELQPDLVIADLMMPVMDGFEYCRQVRDLDSFWDMPIIVQTGVAEPERRAEAFNSGATDLLVKPVNAEELVARVYLHLDKLMLLRRLREYNARVVAELESARQMQNTLLPREKDMREIHHVMPVRLASYFAASTELSGDFWGVHMLSEDELAFYLVDFTGHGVMAALNTFRLHALINSELYPTNNPGDYLTRLNKRLHSLLLDQHFATMFYGVINFTDNKLRYAAAASPGPILLSHDPRAHVSMIDASGLPLGIISGASYETQVIDFVKGDTLMFYSDALIEKEDASGKVFDEDVLMDFVKSYYDKQQQQESGEILPQLLCDTVLDHFYETTGSKTLKDDLTIAIFSHT